MAFHNDELELWWCNLQALIPKKIASTPIDNKFANSGVGIAT